MRHYSATCYHPTSTARMGTDPKAAVVDLELKARRALLCSAPLLSPAFYYVYSLFAACDVL